MPGHPSLATHVGPNGHFKPLQMNGSHVRKELGNAKAACAIFNLQNLLEILRSLPINILHGQKPMCTVLSQETALRTQDFITAQLVLGPLTHKLRYAEFNVPRGAARQMRMVQQGVAGQVLRWCARTEGGRIWQFQDTSGW